MVDGAIPDGPGVVPPPGYIRVQDQHGDCFWVPLSKLQFGPIRQSPLSPELVERIRRFKEVIAEHETTTLEEACSNFQRDANPDGEVLIFERIAATYAAELACRVDASPVERKLLYKAILQCSWSSSLEELLGANPALKALPDLDRVFARYSTGGT